MNGRTPLLSVKDLTVSYGGIRALRGVSFDVYAGQIVTLIGANGAGKSTSLRTVSGLLRAESGSIVFDGRDITRMPPHTIVELGISHVPEGRGIFGNLTVFENLRLAAYSRKDRNEIVRDLERVYGIFPKLKERRNQLGGTLSGGEQQMLAVGRALMTRSKLMLLDEPSMGLSPILVQEIFRVLIDINRAGITILLVEQNAHMALKVASYCYVLETGTVAFSGTAAELLEDRRIKEAYLGGKG
ncbi:MAG: ABC transporter ATP-binding protein [Firmicutes bacterium]|nr:ABC transporter ATP-binding protein [Bacillota bacterium]